MVADTADGADGVVGSVLAHGRYPDGPRSQPPLAAEDDLNPERAERSSVPDAAGQRVRGSITSIVTPATISRAASTQERPFTQPLK